MLLKKKNSFIKTSTNQSHFQTRSDRKKKEGEKERRKEGKKKEYSVCP